MLARLGDDGAYRWLARPKGTCLHVFVLASLKTFQKILYIRFVYWFELMSAYPTRYMCYIFELPRSRSRDMYRPALNIRSGIFLH